MPADVGVQQTASLMTTAAAKFMQMMGSFYTGGRGRRALRAEVPGIQVPGRSEHREEQVLIACPMPKTAFGAGTQT